MTKKSLIFNHIWILTVFCSLLNSCDQTKTNTTKDKTIPPTKDTLFIHNTDNPGRLGWSFNINNKNIYTLPKGEELLLKIEYLGEYSKIMNHVSIIVKPEGNNCTVKKIDNNTFKVFIEDDFKDDILHLIFEGIPDKNTTIINTQHQTAYNYPEKIHLVVLNNLVSDK